MKIRAIIPNEQSHASSWWRIIRPFTMLAKRGHDVKWYLYDDLEVADFKDALVIIHRIIPVDPESYIKNLYLQGARNVVYSNDDYTSDGEALRQYLEASGGLTSFAIDRMVKRASVELETIKICGKLIVSSQGLARLYDDGGSYVQVITLENALDVDWFVEALDDKPPYIGNSDTVYIGYASGRRPQSDMVQMVAAWKRLDHEFPNVRFVVAGWQPDIIDCNINLDKKIRIPWQPLDKWPQSMQVDIGCCPLSVMKFNYGKSPIKFFEYTMAGAAVVCSPLVYESNVFHRVNGYLAYDEDGWYDALKVLIESKTRRADLQDNAQYAITNYYSLEATIENWENKLQELIK